MYENRFDGIIVNKGNTFDFPLHSHYNIELCVCTEGNIGAECNGHFRELASGDVMIAFSNDLHGYRKTNNGHQITVIVSPRVLPGAFREILMSRFENFCNVGNEAIELALKLYDEEYSENDEMTKIGYIVLLLAAVCKNLPKREQGAQLKDDVFTNVVKYISEHCTESFSLRSVATKFGIDYYNLSKMFTRNLSLTFTNYVHILRVEEAKALLRNTDKNITEVCYECGFSDIRSFNRVFKELEKQSPRSFRIKYRK